MCGITVIEDVCRCSKSAVQWCVCLAEWCRSSCPTCLGGSRSSWNWAMTWKRVMNWQRSCQTLLSTALFSLWPERWAAHCISLTHSTLRPSHMFTDCLHDQSSLIPCHIVFVLLHNHALLHLLTYGWCADLPSILHCVEWFHTWDPNYTWYSQIPCFQSLKHCIFRGMVTTEAVSLKTACRVVGTYTSSLGLSCHLRSSCVSLGIAFLGAKRQSLFMHWYPIITLGKAELWVPWHPLELLLCTWWQCLLWERGSNRRGTM